MNSAELSARLYAVRTKLKLTQAELAARWQCNSNTISRIEKGKEPGMIGLYADAVRWLEQEAILKK